MVAVRALRAAYAYGERLVFVLDVDVLAEIVRRIELPATVPPKRGADGAR